MGSKYPVLPPKKIIQVLEKLGFEKHHREEAM
jgi:predicted RNA binding protein YcfA (HicA-like mRNA interferase family)